MGGCRGGRAASPRAAHACSAEPRACELPEFFRRRSLVGAVAGFDLAVHNETAPLYRQFDIKRLSLFGWRPAWRSARLEATLEWPSVPCIDADVLDETLVTLDGPTVASGEIHGVVMWLEDAGRELDPLDTPLEAVLTLRRAEAVRSEQTVLVALRCANSPALITGTFQSTVNVL